LCVPFTELRGFHTASKTIFTGISVRRFLEKISVKLVDSVVKSISPMQVNLIIPIDVLSRKKKRDIRVKLSSLPDLEYPMFFYPWILVLLVLGPSEPDWDSEVWIGVTMLVI
jgi:hypothetical protein